MNNICKNNKEDVFNFLQELESGNNKDFIIKYWQGANTVSESIDNYFSNYIFNEGIKTKKNRYKKVFEKDYNKLSHTIENYPKDTKAQEYKAKADSIMANLYEIKNKDKFFIINNLKIELDENLTPNENAQKYYAKYKKAKTAYEYDLKRYNEAKEKFNYLNTILFNIENASDFEDLKGTEEELLNLGYIKQDNDKEKSQNKIEKIEYGGFDIYIGKNNKQNDYIISNVASKEDLWFHGQGFPSSHVVLKTPNNKKAPSKDVIEYCAKLTKENSKAKNSGKTPIIMTKIKNLKKPPNTYPGYVTYKNEIEIIIN